MDKQLAEQILEPLRRVSLAKARQTQQPTLGARVNRIKAYQSARFEATYSDLLNSPSQQAAARFFLDELYGTRDFCTRDKQFMRVVPALIRLFPHDVSNTVKKLAELHALSEDLDEEMARQIPNTPIGPEHYIHAWQAVGQAEARNQQIALAMEIGRALDVYTRNRWLRNSLRIMRGPAVAAGLSDLQRFLEKGFDAFARMKGAQTFLATIEQREQQLITLLFNLNKPASPQQEVNQAEARRQLLLHLPTTQVN